MKEILVHAIDWTSVKLNLVCILGFISGSLVVSLLAGVASALTIAYNAIRIYKELKNKKS